MNIKATNLSKKYENKIAVDNISFEIRNGQILGLLGPNGAGKSTTIKMLSGQTTPTSGEIILDGVSFKSVPSEYKTKIGVMPQEVIIWDKLTVKENLEFTGKLYKLSSKNIKSRRDYLIEALNLSKELDTEADKLSGGFKRRMNLALTLMNEPSAIFLDEPTPGIDPQNRRFLWEYISNLRSKDRSVILTDHYLDEAEKLADYVVIIDDGRIIAEGTVADLKKKYGSGDLVIIKLSEKNSKAHLVELIAKLQKYYPDTKQIQDSITINAKNGLEVMRHALSEIEMLGIKYEEFQLKEPSLEDIFLILTGKNIRE